MAHYLLLPHVDANEAEYVRLLIEIYLTRGIY